MGAWGFDAMDSDSALDWIHEVTDPAGEAVAKLLKDSRGKEVDFAQELRAAADVVVKLNYFSHRQEDFHYELAVALKKILADREYVESWTEPETYEASVKAQIADLEKGQQPTTLMGNL